MKDYYYLLGLKQTATLDEIKDSYRRLSKKFHPDVNDGDAFFSERFKDIQEAYEILSNSERRKIYDLKYSKKSESSSNNSNFSPEIEFFTADKSEVYIGEEIVFNWKTINADDVKIIPIGDVNPIGSLIYLVRHTKSKEFEFKITEYKFEDFDIDINIIYDGYKGCIYTYRDSDGYDYWVVNFSNLC